MLDENRKILDSISRKNELKHLLFPLILIVSTIGFYYLIKLYDIEQNSVYTTGIILSRNAIISKRNDNFICEIKLNSGETIRTSCHKYRSIGEIVKVEKQTAKGLFFTTTNFYADF